MFHPISRYANRFKSMAQWLNRIIIEIIQICSQNNHTQKISNRTTVPASLSVTIAKFASKKKPELKMVHTSQHISQIPTSTWVCKNVHYGHLCGRNQDQGTAGKRESENSSGLNSWHCQNRASQQSTNPELCLGSSTSPTQVWRLSKSCWVSRTSIHRQGPAVLHPSKGNSSSQVQQLTLHNPTIKW